MIKNHVMKIRGRWQEIKYSKERRSHPMDYLIVLIPLAVLIGAMFLFGTFKLASNNLRAVPPTTLEEVRQNIRDAEIEVLSPGVQLRTQGSVQRP